MLWKRLRLKSKFDERCEIAWDCIILKLSPIFEQNWGNLPQFDWIFLSLHFLIAFFSLLHFSSKTKFAPVWGSFFFSSLFQNKFAPVWSFPFLSDHLFQNKFAPVWGFSFPFPLLDHLFQNKFAPVWGLQFSGAVKRKLLFW